MEFRLLHQVIALTLIAFSLSSLAYTLEDSIPARKAANKTELQWSLCNETSASFARKTGSPLKNSEKRSVYFLETSDMQLTKSHAFLRIREEDRTFKTSAKVNYPDDTQLPWKKLKGKDSKCEWDRYGSFKKVGCSLNFEASSLATAVSKDQKSYIESATAFRAWDQLKILGPASDEEWSWTPDHLPSDLSLEQTTAPGFTSLELSTRVSTEDSDDTYDYVQEWLSQNQVELCPVQRGKSEALIRALLAP
ncbi:MAG: hypothetical protein H7326_06555 [Bdellovibrionaceae bacterium]|nr:hypothetical protein [Pseudobdellovibrionaceae bacterium]